MTSSNGKVLGVTGLVCGEFTGHRWISRTKASGAELWCFLDVSKQSWGWWFETPSRSLWRHCDELASLGWWQYEKCAKHWKFIMAIIYSLHISNIKQIDPKGRVSLMTYGVLNRYILNIELISMWLYYIDIFACHNNTIPVTHIANNCFQTVEKIVKDLPNIKVGQHHALRNGTNIVLNCINNKIHWPHFLECIQVT